MRSFPVPNNILIFNHSDLSYAQKFGLSVNKREGPFTPVSENRQYIVRILQGLECDTTEVRNSLVHRLI